MGNLLDALILLLLSFCFAFSVATKGMSTIFPILATSAVSAILVGVVPIWSQPSHVMLDSIIVISALIVGAFSGYLYDRSAQPWRLEVVSDILLRLLGDKRVRVIICAALVAIVVTSYFAGLVAHSDRTSFWFGFYQSWTASLVFFAILGIAGTIVSLYRPENDEFSQRVRILCGGRSDATVAFIREQARRLGYFSEEVVREYRILQYDPTLEAFFIEVTHESFHRNFYDDQATELGCIKIKADSGSPPGATVFTDLTGWR